MLCASVSCRARLSLQHLMHLRLRSLWIIRRETDDRWIPLLHMNFLWLFGGSEVCISDSATATQLCRRFHQYAHCVCRCPDACPPVDCSELHQQPVDAFFVQPLSKNSVITTKRYNLYIHTDLIKILSSLLNGIKVRAFAWYSVKLALFSMSGMTSALDHIDTAKQGQGYESIVSRYEYWATGRLPHPPSKSREKSLLR